MTRFNYQHLSSMRRRFVTATGRNHAPSSLFSSSSSSSLGGASSSSLSHTHSSAAADDRIVPVVQDFLRRADGFVSPGELATGLELLLLRLYASTGATYPDLLGAITRSLPPREGWSCRRAPGGGGDGDCTFTAPGGADRWTPPSSTACDSARDACRCQVHRLRAEIEEELAEPNGGARRWGRVAAIVLRVLRTALSDRRRLPPPKATAAATGKPSSLTLLVLGWEPPDARIVERLVDDLIRALNSCTDWAEWTFHLTLVYDVVGWHPAVSAATVARRAIVAGQRAHGVAATVGLACGGRCVAAGAPCVVCHRARFRAYLRGEPVQDYDWNDYAAAVELSYAALTAAPPSLPFERTASSAPSSSSFASSRTTTTASSSATGPSTSTSTSTSASASSAIRSSSSSSSFTTTAANSSSASRTSAGEARASVDRVVDDMWREAGDLAYASDLSPSDCRPGRDVSLDRVKLYLRCIRHWYPAVQATGAAVLLNPEVYIDLVRSQGAEVHPALATLLRDCARRFDRVFLPGLSDGHFFLVVVARDSATGARHAVVWDSCVPGGGADPALLSARLPEAVRAALVRADLLYPPDTGDRWRSSVRFAPCHPQGPNQCALFMLQHTEVLYGRTTAATGGGGGGGVPWWAPSPADIRVNDHIAPERAGAANMADNRRALCRFTDWLRNHRNWDAIDRRQLAAFSGLLVSRGNAS